MAEVAYRSEVRVERGAAGVRRAFLPTEKSPVLFGVHSAVAAHYGRAPGSYEPHATTIDYLVAAAAG
ncbi:MAG TPA: hypothetical protein VIV59_13850 [Anaeromyxobacteraceae bacterium]